MKKIGLFVTAILITSMSYSQVFTWAMDKNITRISKDYGKDISLLTEELLADIKDFKKDIKFDMPVNQFNFLQEDEDNKTRKRRYYHFKGHWEGFEIGLNTFLDSDYAMTLPPGAEFMELNTGKSWNVNINFMQYSIGLVANNIGIVTGLGFEFNNYHFDGNNNIHKDATGIIEELPYAFSLEKSKLATTYLTLPLLLEISVPGRRDGFHISGGAIAGVKLSSRTKVIYRDGGDKQKDKVKGDFNLSPLRYGLTARIGFKMINLYANYYITPFFEDGKGPELYPFSIGLVLCDF